MKDKVTKEHIRAFREMVHGDPDRPVILETDPSGGGETENKDNLIQHNKGDSMQKEREIDAGKVIQSLQRRIGEIVSQYETELAVKDAIINSLEEELNSSSGDSDE